MRATLPLLPDKVGLVTEYLEKLGDNVPNPRTLGPETAWEMNWKISARSNRLTNLVVALKAGLGIAALPHLVGDADLELVRCLPLRTRRGSAKKLWSSTSN